MPSNKPKIVILTEQEVINKFREIARKENRTMSNLGELLICDYIEKYEINNNIHDNKNVLINQKKIETVNMN